MRILIINVFLICSIVIQAQSTIVFSKQYDFGDSGNNHLSFSVFNYGNDYLLAGATSSATSNFWGLGIIRTDSTGNIKWQKQVYGHSGFSYGSNAVGQMFIRLVNGNLLFTGQYPIAIDYTRAVLARVNQNTGDTIWVKEYTQPGDTCYLQCSAEQSDSSIISIGYKYYTTTTSTLTAWPFIMKTDKNGIYKWHKYLGASINHEPSYQKILRITDNDFRVIACNFYNANNYQGSIIRLDTNANIIYNVGTTGINYSFLYDLIKLQDGNFLAVGGYWSYHNSTTGDSKYRKLLYKFNGTTGSKIIDKEYNWPANSNGIIAVHQQTDGSIIASGGTGYTSPINTYNSEADLLKLDSNLDSVKTMYIKNGIVNDNKGSCSFLLMPDGGFAIAMQVYPSSSKEKFWLIKTDSLGCDSVNCAATIGVNVLSKETATMKMYPNPTSKTLYLSALNIDFENSEIEIINVLGQIIFRSHFTNEIDVSKLSNGCYTLKIITKEKQQFHSKFIKE